MNWTSFGIGYLVAFVSMAVALVVATYLED